MTVGDLSAPEQRDAPVVCAMPVAVMCVQCADGQEGPGFTGEHWMGETQDECITR